MRRTSQFFYRNRAFTLSALFLFGCAKLYKFGSAPIDFGAGTAGPDSGTATDNKCTNLEKFSGLTV